MKTPYCIITSDSGDWYIAAKKVGEEVTVLYENHSRAGALEAIIKDFGLRVREVERDMSSGGYFPKARDWR